MLISAFWHGFYPFYYVMFFNAALFVELSKDIYRSRILFQGMPDWLSYLITNQGTMFVCNYLGVSFNQLTFSRGYRFAVATGFLGWIIIVGGLLLFKFGGIAQMAKKMKQESTPQKPAMVVDKDPQ